MRHISFNRLTGSLLCAAGLALVAAVACGAAKVESDAGGGGPLAPSTYDPQVSLAPLVDRVAPAVVNIKTSSKVSVPGSLGSDNLFEWFFGPRGPGHPQVLPRNEREITRRSVGSGFIIDSSGLVVTNHHVVQDADEIEVQLADERTFSAQLVGSDERTDVALLRLLDAKQLPNVEFGDSEQLRVGDRVVAIGNPFGLDHTVTSGIVSAKERVIGAGPYDDFIQTDASINPGNSGGPLFNLRGQVIGINTAIAPRGQGIGFAIPADLAVGVIAALRGNGKVVRGWLGIAFQPLDEKLAAAFAVKDRRGAIVANVTAGSPAAKGGMLAGDVIVEVAGKQLTSARQLPVLVAALKPGTQAELTVIRGKKPKTLKIEIGEMADGAGGAAISNPQDEKAQHTGLGFEVVPLTDDLRRRLGVEAGQGGVVVARVDGAGVVASALHKGDLIVEVNRETVGSIDEFKRLTADLETGDDILLLVKRGSNWSYLVLRL